jgi:hypothetical protein
MNKRQRDLLSLAYGGAVVDPAAFGEALKAAVLLFDKLPVTKNGVCRIPGIDKVTGRDEDGSLRTVVLDQYEYHEDVGEWLSYYFDMYVSDLFSSPETAEAAHHLANGPHDHDHLEGE